MIKLALSVKWISGLVLSLLLAVAFSLLAQWQVSRAVIPNSNQVSSFALATVDLQDVAEPGKSFTFNEFKTSGSMGFLTGVQSKAILTPTKAVLVANRFQQKGQQGFWVVVPGNTSEGNVFVAVGFAKNIATAQNALSSITQLPATAIGLKGRYLPSEEPLNLNSDGTYSSLAVPQLLNNLKWDNQLNKTYAGFIADTTKNIFVPNYKLEPLDIGLPKSDSQVNWLSSFYAIEWTFFACFGVFIWWRLLADSYKKQQEALLG